eukprot:tig00000525_g1958.t2
MRTRRAHRSTGARFGRPQQRRGTGVVRPTSVRPSKLQHRRPSDDFDLRSREDHQIARAYVVAARDLVPLSESVWVFPHLWTPSVRSGLGTALLYEMGVIDEPLPPEEAPGFVLKNLFRIAFQCVLAASSTQHYKRARPAPPRPGAGRGRGQARRAARLTGAQAGVHGGAPLLRGELTPMPDFPQDEYRTGGGGALPEHGNAVRLVLHWAALPRRAGQSPGLPEAAVQAEHGIFYKQGGRRAADGRRRSGRAARRAARRASGAAGGAAYQSNGVAVLR